ncbi:dolichol-phosphate mannosyltransferase [Desulfovibrionales bacterium]
MKQVTFNRPFVFSLIIPCYNEEQTLEFCLARVLEIQDAMLTLDIIIVDDCSQDRSYEIAQELVRNHPEIQVLKHNQNQGKGAALRTGFAHARGEFVGVQDADLEYNPMELRNLLVPLVSQGADMVFGSRYLTGQPRRVLYFWHSLTNRTLTFLSNMFTDLDLTDMETCYKLFRREVIQSVLIEENRFGFEPEIVAKVAQMRGRIWEMGISYHGRTFAEGKKIYWKDGVRALYCILHYNGPRLPLPLQFIIYLFIGGVSALINLTLFGTALATDWSISMAATLASVAAAGLNYWLCIKLLFRHKARWNTFGEIFTYSLVVMSSCLVDVLLTTYLANSGLSSLTAKAMSCVVVLALNFLGRRFLVFPEPATGPWKP